MKICKWTIPYTGNEMSSDNIGVMDLTLCLTKTINLNLTEVILQLYFLLFPNTKFLMKPDQILQAEAYLLLVNYTNQMLTIEAIVNLGAYFCFYKYILSLYSC